ncbi:hypothetical protein BH24ACT3_BH24ACT3_01080 [soil metagenome]
MAGGRLIALEGGEGCGKSTQARLLAASLGAVLTHEPGGTAVGGRLRDILLDPTVELGARTEALLMAADRAEHVATVVRPALERGCDVVTDRFIGSSLAYQGHGRDLPVDEVRSLSAWATGGLDADLVVFLDVPAWVAATRRRRPHDRLDAAGVEFHRRVLDGFARLAADDPARWVAVDGTGSVEAVATAVRAVVDERLGHVRGGGPGA